MIIRQLSLHNFGAYRDGHCVNLEPSSPNRPIILFGGMNGAGKTTLLDAILLCLYGPVAKTSNRGGAGYQTYLKECVNRHAERQEAAVSLSFLEHRNGQLAEFKIRRSWRVQSTVAEEFSVHVDGKEDTFLAENWLDYIEGVIPARIANLFFFDGEKIEGFAELENSKSILEAALHSLLGLDLMNQLYADLTVLERRKRTEIQDEGERIDIARLQDEVADLREERVALRNAHARDLLNLDEAEKHLAKARGKYERKGGKYYEQREELAAEKKRLVRLLAECEEQLHELAAGEAPLLLVGDLIDDIVRQGEAEQKAAESAILCDMLEQRDAKVVAALRESLPAAEIARLTTLLAADREAHGVAAHAPRYLELSPSALNDIRTVQAILPRVESDYRRATAKREDYTELLAKLEDRIQSIPPPDVIKPILEECERWENQVVLCRASIEGASTQIDTMGKRIAFLENSLNAKIERAIKLEFDADDSSRIISFAGSARETLVQLRQEVIHKHLGTIEQLILDCFRQLNRKAGLIERIAISAADYSLQIFGQDGKELKPNRLSAGERQILAVSMLWGLGKASGVQLPVVIDTPLGRLDGDHRSKLVASYFPKASSQVLVLSTDEEIANTHLEELAPAIDKTYLITFDEAQRTSMITPGYFAGQEVIRAN